MTHILDDVQKEKLENMKPVFRGNSFKKVENMRRFVQEEIKMDKNQNIRRLQRMYRTGEWPRTL